MSTEETKTKGEMLELIKNLHLKFDQLDWKINTNDKMYTLSLPEVGVLICTVGRLVLYDPKSTYKVAVIEDLLEDISKGEPVFDLWKRIRDSVEKKDLVIREERLSHVIEHIKNL